MTPSKDNDPVYDMSPDNAPPSRDEHLPAQLDEHQDAHAEETPARGPVTETPVKLKVKSSLAGGTWAALIIGALLLITLLVFILQNQQEVELQLLSWTFAFPAGIAYLFAAVTGALIMALVGGVRMLELRRQVKRRNRLQG